MKNTAATLAGEIRELTRQLGRNGWEIGDRLVKAKAVVSDADWPEWLHKACGGYAPCTARRLMQLRRAFPDGDVPFSQTAAILLSQNWVPEAARIEAKAEAKADKPVTVTRAAEIAEKFRPWEGDPEAEPELPVRKPHQEFTRTFPDAQEERWDGFSKDFVRMNAGRLQPYMLARKYPALCRDVMTRGYPIVQAERAASGRVRAHA